jgi:hypothetical protein
MMEKHGWCFDWIAACVITQLKFKHGDGLLFDVEYDVTYD